MKTDGRFGEAALFGDGEKGFELVQVHGEAPRNRDEGRGNRD
jgi:hypothetical protein